MVRAILLELDEVMVPARGPSRAALRAACAATEERRSWPQGALAGAIEAAAEARWQGLAAAAGWGADTPDWEPALWSEPMRESRRWLPGLVGASAWLQHEAFVAGLLACGATGPGFATLIQRRLVEERQRRLQPAAGLGALVEALRTRGMTIACVAHGWPEAARATLRATGVEALSDATFVAAEDRVRRPRPQLFVRLAARLGVDPAELLYVGATAAALRAAREAGLQTVLLERGEVEVSARAAVGRVIFELQGLLGLVDGLAAGRAFRARDAAGALVAIDLPETAERGFSTRVGPEADALRPAVLARTEAEVVLAALRALRARTGEAPLRLARGEPLDWDALLR